MYTVLPISKDSNGPFVKITGSAKELATYGLLRFLLMQQQLELHISARSLIRNRS